MDPQFFAAKQRAHIVRAERGYLAFVPPPLPPDLRLDENLVSALSTADRAVGELAGVGRTLAQPEILLAPIIRREAVLSSRIEGTRASLSDLVLFEVEPGVADRATDVQEVLNNVRALEHVISPRRRLPLSLPLLLEAHEILMTSVRGGYATPGQFRRSQNWIGHPGSTLDDATFVPPPPDRMWECLDTLEKFLHAAHDLPPLILIGCAHYQFEAIHPFIDGNGRVGRLLIALLLIEWGLLDSPMLDISAYIEPRRADYYDRLLRVSTHGDWAAWLDYFLRAVATQASDATRRAHALQNLRDRYRESVSSARASSLLPLLIDTLFHTPALTIARAAEVLGVSRRAATQTIERLISVGVLAETPRAGRARLFIAREILNVASGQGGPGLAE